MSGMDRLTAIERHADTERNRILNIALTDLNAIINGHNPDVDTSINNMVWDRLDKLACDVELRALRRASQAAPAPSDGLLPVVARVEGSPEWHLAKVLGYICSDPSALRGLEDDDTLSMDVFVRVGDIRAAYSSLIQTFGSDGNEEARWISDVENACSHCGGSGHKDDAAPSDGLREAAATILAVLEDPDSLPYEHHPNWQAIYNAMTEDHNQSMEICGMHDWPSILIAGLEVMAQDSAALTSAPAQEVKP